MPKAQVFLEKPETHFDSNDNVLQLNDEYFEYDDIFKSTEDIHIRILRKAVLAFLFGDDIFVAGIASNPNHKDYIKIFFRELMKFAMFPLNDNYKAVLNSQQVKRVKNGLDAGFHVHLYSVVPLTANFITKLESGPGNVLENFKNSLKYEYMHPMTDMEKINVEGEQLFIFRRMVNNTYNLQDSFLYYAHLNTARNDDPVLDNTLRFCRLLLLNDKIDKPSQCENKGVLFDKFYEASSSSYFLIKLDPLRLTMEEIKRILYFTCKNYTCTSASTSGSSNDQLEMDKVKLLSQKIKKERKEHAQELQTLELKLRHEITNELLNPGSIFLTNLHAFLKTQWDKYKNDSGNKPDDRMTGRNDMESGFEATEVAVIDKIKSLELINNMCHRETQTQAPVIFKSYVENDLSYQLKNYSSAYNDLYLKYKKCQKKLEKEVEESSQLQKLLNTERSGRTVLESKLSVSEENLKESNRGLQNYVKQLTELRVNADAEVEELRKELRKKVVELHKAETNKSELIRTHEDEIRSLRNLYNSQYSPKYVTRPPSIMRINPFMRERLVFNDKPGTSKEGNENIRQNIAVDGKESTDEDKLIVISDDNSNDKEDNLDGKEPLNKRKVLKRKCKGPKPNKKPRES